MWMLHFMPVSPLLAPGLHVDTEGLDTASSAHQEVQDGEPQGPGRGEKTQGI